LAGLARADRFQSWCVPVVYPRRSRSGLPAARVFRAPYTPPPPPISDICHIAARDPRHAAVVAARRDLGAAEGIARRITGFTTTATRRPAVRISAVAPGCGRPPAGATSDTTVSDRGAEDCACRVGRPPRQGPRRRGAEERAERGSEAKLEAVRAWRWRRRDRRHAWIRDGDGNGAVSELVVAGTTGNQAAQPRAANTTTGP
jgi:hypothetical protein